MRFLAFCRLELSALLRRRGEIAVSLSIFVMGVSLFALAQPARAATVDGMRAAIWVTIFLLSAFTQFSLFDGDRRSGFLEQWPLLPLPLEAVATAKLLSHWLVFGFGYISATPVAAVLASLPAAEIAPLLYSLVPASLCLTALGGVAASAALRFRHGEAIGILLVLPLGVPVVIFAAGGSTGFMLLLAAALIVLPLGIFATARLLRYPA